jgi:hypothetical protein
MRHSNFSDFSGEIHLNDEEPANPVGFKNGKEYLDEIEMKRKQNDVINKAAKKIEKRLSKKSVMVLNIKNDDEANIETFSVEHNHHKKNDLHTNLLPNNNNNINDKNNFDDNKFLIRDYNLSRTSKAFHEMEDKVFIALEGPRQNIIRRHWIIFLLIFFLIIILIYYFFISKKK